MATFAALLAGFEGLLARLPELLAVAAPQSATRANRFARRPIAAW